MCLKEIGLESVGWIHLANYSQVVGCYEHGNEPLASMQYRAFSH
jgi:hypothetical protein